MRAIAWHYCQADAGNFDCRVAIGAIAGHHGWGHGMAMLYGEFYSFPFLVFSQNPDLIDLRACKPLPAALDRGANAIWVRLRFAAGQVQCGHRRQPDTAACSDRCSAGGFRLPVFPQLTVMALRTSGALAIFATAVDDLGKRHCRWHC